jgi:hypothetical protein
MKDNNKTYCHSRLRLSLSLAMALGFAISAVIAPAWSQDQSQSSQNSQQRAPLQGGIDLNAVQGDAQDTILQGGAGDWGGQPNAQQGMMDQSQPLMGGASGNAPLNGSASEDPDNSPELSIEWDRWRNTLMQTIQSGVLANINVHNDTHFVWDQRTQMMQSRYPNGTSAWYALNVLPNRKIINIRLTQISQFPTYDQAVFQAINSLQGNKILNYPRGSKRRIVAQEGNVSTSPQSSFTNYNFGDVERQR